MNTISGFLQKIGVWISVISSFIVATLSLGLLTDIFGVFIGGVIALFLLPIVVVFAPLYDAFNNDFWYPLLMQGIMIFGFFLFLCGLFIESKF